jgi:hypothetical protein
MRSVRRHSFKRSKSCEAGINCDPVAETLGERALDRPRNCIV